MTLLGWAGARDNGILRRSRRDFRDSQVQVLGGQQAFFRASCLYDLEDIGHAQEAGTWNLAGDRTPLSEVKYSCCLRYRSHKSSRFLGRTSTSWPTSYT